MSVWNTFSAGLHMVQEKLEHVLEDTAQEEGEEQVSPQMGGLVGNCQQWKSRINMYCHMILVVTSGALLAGY